MPGNDKNKKPKLPPKVPRAPSPRGGMKVPKANQINSGFAGNNNPSKNSKKAREEELKQLAKSQRERQKEFNQRQKDREKEEKLKQKDERHKERLQRKQEKLVEREERRPGIRDLSLDNISNLERTVLSRKDDPEKRRKAFIISLLVFLIVLVSYAASTIIQPIIDGGETPVQVEILLEAQNLDTTELIDPDHPELGVKNRLFYPGDSFDVELYITNRPNVGSFPVFLKFKASVEVDGQSDPFIFTPTYHNERDWIRAYNTDNQLVDEWAYYADYLGAYETVQILDALTIKEQLGEEYENKSFVLTLTVETIEGNVEAIEDFESWYYAPQEWKDHISNLEVPNA